MRTLSPDQSVVVISKIFDHAQVISWRIIAKYSECSESTAKRIFRAYNAGEEFKLRRKYLTAISCKIDIPIKELSMLLVENREDIYRPIDKNIKKFSQQYKAALIAFNLNYEIEVKTGAASELRMTPGINNAPRVIRLALLLPGPPVVLDVDLVSGWVVVFNGDEKEPPLYPLCARSIAEALEKLKKIVDERN